MLANMAFTNVYNKGWNNNKNMTREEFIEKAKELATDFWTMNLRDGTYESKFTELLDEYEGVYEAQIKPQKYSMKQILEQIINRNTEGNYLLSSTDKVQMVSEILNLFGVVDSFISKFEEIIYGGFSDSEIVNALQKLDNER